jgi:hypothetical protein
VICQTGLLLQISSCSKPLKLLPVPPTLSDPMDKEGPSITLNFDSKQLWMAKPCLNVHISYKTLSTAPPFSPFIDHLD